MSDDRLQVAIDVVARNLLARAAEEVAAEDWDLIPEVGQRDWEAIGRRLAALAPSPPVEEFHAAYEFLEFRASSEASA